MNLERFVRERGPDWDELDRALQRAGRRPERLGPDGVMRLARLYRGAAADLAFARRRFVGDPVVTRLDSLVRRARVAVYARGRTEGETIGAFVVRGYWRRVRERPRPVGLAWLLLLAPAVLAAVWGLDDPGAAVGVVPDEFRGSGAESGDVGLSGGEQAAVSSAIFTNNIQVTFLAFAAGIAAGLGTAAILVYNGLILGALAGIVGGQGDGALFAELVVPHGVLELSCIAVTAGAGLRLGWALVAPGPRTRGAALVAEGRPAVEIVIGTIPWLVLAGLVEGFVTGSGLGLGLALAIGIGLGAVYWALVLGLGGPRRVPATWP